jgi:hypothetical protein
MALVLLTPGTFTAAVVVAAVAIRATVRLVALVALVTVGLR